MPKIEVGMILKERYKITKLLGSGGMGEVFLADDLSLETQVAVKINHNLNETSSAQFIREARLLASLKHPNLPRVIDYFTDADCQYLVMDYIPGDDLKTIVERHDKIGYDLILKWAVELGNALTYLHVHKPPIFHRDIKPANIKLTPTGEVILVDFGIAKTGEASQETQSGAWAFSPGFAPPEQVSGMRTGQYSDLYSLAATIYYLYVGTPPADSAQRMMGTVQYVPLNRAKPDVPENISDVIGKALAIKPDDRFATVADFLTALTNPDTTKNREESQKTMMAQRGPAAPTGALPPVPPPTDQKKRKSPVVGIVIGIAALVVVGVVGFFALRSMGIIGGAAAATQFVPSPTMMAVVEKTTESVPTSTAEIAASATEAPLPSNTPEPTTAAVVTSIGKGGKVAFVSNRQGDGYNQIWLMDVGKDANGGLVASNFTQLTTTDGDKSDPSWSPDGTKLLFTAPSTQFAQNGTPFAKDIWVLDLTQANPTPVDLTNKAGDDIEASWEPNGKKIAWTSYYRDDRLPQLFLMDPDGKEQTRLSERFAEHSPTWTPDGSYLMYVMDYQGFNVLAMRDVWSVYKDIRNFDRTSDAGRLGLATEPKISADGSTIVYTRTTGVDTTNIYTAVFNDRGSTITQITDSGKDNYACWSPDGKWILFASSRDESSEIYIVGADGQNLTNLTNYASEDTQPAWQPETTK